MPEEYWANAVFSLLPSLTVGVIFLLVIRGIMGADRNERKAYEAAKRAELSRMAGSLHDSSIPGDSSHGGPAA